MVSAGRAEDCSPGARSACKGGISTADQHQICRLQLIPKQFINGRDVIEAWVLLPLSFQRFSIRHRTPFREGFAIHQGDDTIDVNPTANLGPIQRLQQGAWQGQCQKTDKNVRMD